MAGFKMDELPTGWLIAAGIGVVLLAGTVIWFAIPGPDASHHFVSPSGAIALDIGERCGEVCDRRIIAETTGPDGRKARRGCEFTLTETHSVLLNAWPLWAENEQTVEIVYSDAEGAGGKLLLDLGRDCTITE